MADNHKVSQSEAALAAEAERVRGILSRYLSPRVADAVLGEAHAAHGPGQVRSATILLCDLRGFTRYAETTPPTEVAHSLNEFLNEMTQVVFKYDGMLDKYTGDGLMAVFGAPYAQPDHAERAVHAALEMQARHQHLLQQWAGDRRARLELGIGMQSGEVIAGNFGSAQRVDYTVIGHPVNVAARLTAVAPPGQTLLGEETQRLVAPMIVAEPLGPASLKNVAEPVAAYRLLGLLPGHSAFCLECGGRIPPQSSACPHCGFRRVSTLLPTSSRDGLLTVARVSSTLTTLQRSPGPHLIAVAGPHQGADFAVTFPCAIGREALVNQIVLSLDPSVSRRHAVLHRDEQGAVVTDLASQNGTFVNDEPVHTGPIRDGDVLNVGRTRLVVSGLRETGRRL